MIKAYEGRKPPWGFVIRAPEQTFLIIKSELITQEHNNALVYLNCRPEQLDMVDKGIFFE